MQGHSVPRSERSPLLSELQHLQHLQLQIISNSVKSLKSETQSLSNQIDDPNMSKIETRPPSLTWQDVFSSFSSSARYRELQQPSWDPGKDTLGASGGLLLSLVRQKLAPKHHFSFLDFWTKRAELILSQVMPLHHSMQSNFLRAYSSCLRIKTTAQRFWNEQGADCIWPIRMPVERIQ